LTNNEHYVPERSRHKLCHELRPCRHNKELITYAIMISGNDFMIRMLHKNIY